MPPPASPKKNPSIDYLSAVRIVEVMRVPRNKAGGAAEYMLASFFLRFAPMDNDINHKILQRFPKIAKLAANLLVEIERLNDRGELAALLFLDEQQFFTYQETTKILVECSGRIRVEKKEAHRPRGRIKNPQLESLIAFLEVVAYRWGGKLTFGRNTATNTLNGTLPPILTILRPYFPEVIPARLPYSTIRRMHKKLRDRRKLPHSPPPLDKGYWASPWAARIRGVKYPGDDRR